jgi:arginine decarboxylase
LTIQGGKLMVTAHDAALDVSRRAPSANPEQQLGWSPERSAQRYQITGWGSPYFQVNARGQVEVTPNPDRQQCINLHELTLELRARGLELPLLIRFSDIVGDRIKRLNEAFGRAIAEYEYPGIYRGVYPVKVNQQRHLVEEIVHYGRAWSFGLEAGSKPELLIALAAMQDVGGLIICNGYKDQKYIETALVAQKFDKTVIVVLERIEELDLVLRAAEKVGIKPILGVRAKLTTRGVGRWADSAGDRAKFGLTTSEMVEVVDRLAERGMLDCLQLLHFHIGSQISSIIPIKNAMQEASNIYVELAKMGAKMGYLDVGGGLAVDYDGSKTRTACSRSCSKPTPASSRRTCRRATTTPAKPRKRRRACSSTATCHCASARRWSGCSGTAARRSTRRSSVSNSCPRSSSTSIRT